MTPTTIVARLEQICRIFNTRRRVGHTSLLIKGVQNTNSILIVQSHHQKEAIRRENPTINIITENEMEPQLMGRREAIAVDHFVITNLCADAGSVIENLKQDLILAKLLADGRLKLLHGQEARHQKEVEALSNQRDALRGALHAIQFIGDETSHSIAVKALTACVSPVSDNPACVSQNPDPCTTKS